MMNLHEALTMIPFLLWSEAGRADQQQPPDGHGPSCQGSGLGTAMDLFCPSSISWRSLGDEG